MLPPTVTSCSLTAGRRWSTTPTSITVSVPNTWTDIDTTPRANDDGTVMPSIEAATNIQAFNDTFDEPGVLYRAISYDADQQALMDRTA